MGQRRNASAPLLIQKVSVIMKYDLGVIPYYRKQKQKAAGD